MGNNILKFEKKKDKELESIKVERTRASVLDVFKFISNMEPDDDIEYLLSKVGKSHEGIIISLMGGYEYEDIADFLSNADGILVVNTPYQNVFFEWGSTMKRKKVKELEGTTHIYIK